MYCNYSKDKFGNELTFIIPSWLNMPEGTYYWEDSNPLVTAGEDIRDAGWDDYSNISVEDEEGNGWNEYKHPTFEEDLLCKTLQCAEDTYFTLLKSNFTPQQARQVLPNALKTEINMCGFTSDWKHFFELRDSEAAHPDMRALVKPLHKVLQVTK